MAPELTDLQQRLAANRAEVQALRDRARQRFAAGTGGIHLATGYAAAMEALVVRFWEDAVAALPPEDRRLLGEESAVVAVGGTGRGELAPYSDVDLLFLTRKHPSPQFQACVAQMVRDLWDAGLTLGHSLRSLDDALGMARREPQFATALVEARRLWGAAPLVEQLLRRFTRQIVRARIGPYIDDCVAARAAEFEKRGGSTHELEPDIKRAPGGLRDLHLIRWIGFGVFQSVDFDLLRLQGAFPLDDAHALLAAQDFLLRLRFDLHLHAGKPEDVLSRDEQLRIAEAWQIPGVAGQRPVERFMQQYFQHTTAVAEIAQRFVALHRPRPWGERFWRYVMTHRNGVFLVSPRDLDVPPRQRAAVCQSLDRLLNLYDLASLYQVLPAPALCEAIQRAAPALPDHVPPRCSETFLAILARSQGLGPVLRSMVATRLLDKILPEFTHTRCLLQFNQYHKYTVDEHTLRMLEACTAFERSDDLLGRAYREIPHKDILHLAILLHDAGKGYTEDHSEVGRRLALTVAERYRLSPQRRDLLAWLVHKHLVMANLALRRNVHDPDVYIPFSREVGSPEILRMLFVLTAADIMAVGPGVWTEWKAELLDGLYSNALQELTGESSRQRDEIHLEKIRLDVHACLGTDGRNTATDLTPDWVNARLDTLPPHYLAATPPGQIAGAVRCIHRLGQRDVLVTSDYDPITRTIEHHVITREAVGSGCFSKIAGVLAAKRLEILSAEIHTSSEGIILDTFRVVDPDFDGPVPGSRLQEIESAIRDVILGSRTVEELFRMHRRFNAQPPAVPDQPTRVVIDNESSDRYTIIDVFAHDRVGLLYAICSALRELDISVSLARITTHIDQVVDVFYVTDLEGRKLPHTARLGEICQRLTERIDAAAI